MTPIPSSHLKSAGNDYFLLIGFIWAIVAAAAGLTAIVLAKDNQAVLFLVLTVGLAVIAVAAAWRLWTPRKQPAD